MLVRPIAAGLSGVAAYLAQDYVGAESMDLAIREYGPAPPLDALRVAAHLGAALDFAAAVDVHHGALHPRDVLLSAEETRLTGIGVVRVLECIGLSAPVRRPYTAPERIAGAALDRRADVYSLAAVIFELLSGRRVTGPGEQPAEAVAGVQSADSRRLREVFARALAEEPAARFDTALEFVDALKGAFAPGSLVGRDIVDSPRRAVVTAPPQPTLLPLDQPEAPDHADEEVPVAVEPDFPVAELEEPRYEAVEVAPAVAQSAAPTAHEALLPPSSQSAVWPLALALAVGLAVGYAGGFAVGSRERPVASTAAAATAAPAAREFTETPVAAPVKPPAAPKHQAAPPSAKSAALAADPDAAAAGGRLLVRSTPAGARVSVDGRDAGVTPATVRDLARGTHRVQITHDGYVTEERRIVISRGRPSQSLIVSLARGRAVSTGATDSNPPAATPGTMGQFVGGLVVDSRPTGARVFLDGRLVGTTPATVSTVGSGEHVVRLELDGYRRWSSSIRIVAGEQNRVTASLEK